MSVPMSLTRALLGIAPLKAAWRRAGESRGLRDAPAPPALRRLCTVEHRMLGGFPVTLVTPREHATGTQLVYLHGGGYVGPVIAAHWSIITSLVERSGATVVVPSYGLAPEHTAVQAYPFLDEVYRQALDRAAPTGSPVFVAGDSAGGGLAVGLALRCRDGELPPPAGLLLFSPWLDVRLESPAIAALESRDPLLERSNLVEAGELWAAGSPGGTADPQVSPLTDPLAGLPPTFVYQGDRDILLPDAKAFAAKARAAGSTVELRLYPGAIHVFVGAGWTPEAKRALAHAAGRMRDLGGTP
ncbi:alpha/beta hydrolase [Herbiconiux sp. YIM B11900]|uniref:alpha/beta hydrolase n=1 Tax=Herbiconiux sp. YIM B11900 TaxID=3404131 RepID=UPI003F835843